MCLKASIVRSVRHLLKLSKMVDRNEKNLCFSEGVRFCKLKCRKILTEYKLNLSVSEKDSWWSQIIFKLRCSLQAWCIEKISDKYILFIFQYSCFQAAGTFAFTNSLATALLSPCSPFGEQKKKRTLAVCHEQKAALGLCFKINTIMGF